MAPLHTTADDELCTASVMILSWTCRWSPGTLVSVFFFAKKNIADLIWLKGKVIRFIYLFIICTNWHTILHSTLHFEQKENLNITTQGLSAHDERQSTYALKLISLSESKLDSAEQVKQCLSPKLFTSSNKHLSHHSLLTLTFSLSLTHAWSLIHNNHTFTDSCVSRRWGCDQSRAIAHQHNHSARKHAPRCDALTSQIGEKLKGENLTAHDSRGKLKKVNETTTSV